VLTLVFLIFLDRSSPSRLERPCCLRLQVLPSRRAMWLNNPRLLRSAKGTFSSALLRITCDGGQSLLAVDAAEQANPSHSRMSTSSTATLHSMDVSSSPTSSAFVKACPQPQGFLRVRHPRQEGCRLQCLRAPLPLPSPPRRHDHRLFHLRLLAATVLPRGMPMSVEHQLHEHLFP
jgi:hypothetical protein